MKNIKPLFITSIVLLTMLFSCSDQQPLTEYTVTITGLVKRAYGTAPLDSIITTLDKPFRRDSIGSDGVVNISFTATSKTAVNAKLVLSRERFQDTTVEFTYSSTAKEVALGAMVLRALPEFSAEDSLARQKPSSSAGQVVYKGSDNAVLSIQDGGGISSANLSFEVQDSVGNPVDKDNQVNVNFRFITRPDGETYFNVDSSKTNASGVAQVRLYAGQRSGIAQVQAFAVNEAKDTLKSPIVSIPIYGGLPDSAHFSLGTQKYNIPGRILYNKQYTFSGIVGDKFGNPVQPGTVIYFTTTGGIIAGSATTATGGTFAVNLTTGNPQPPNGIATITAQVGTKGGVPNFGKKGSTKSANIFSKLQNKNSVNTTNAILFSHSVPVLFSGRTQISTSTNNFAVPLGGVRTLNFVVSDDLGNPLTEGTKIKVTMSGLATTEAEISGDVDVTLPDTYSQQYTQFSVQIADRRDSITSEKQFSLTINVTSENGSGKYTLQGTLSNDPNAGTNPELPETSRGAAQIAYLGISEPDLYVAGAGGKETTTLTYEVRDSSGLPITAKNRVNAVASLEFYPNSSIATGSSPILIPSVDSTDDAGRLHFSITSGTLAGVVQLKVNVTTNGNNIITSQPVKISIHSGFPDQGHFSILLTRYSFAGFGVGPDVSKAFFSAAVGDEFSNPVPEGTAIYFHSQAGIIQTGSVAYTKVDGITPNVELTTYNPQPNAAGTAYAGRPTFAANFGPGYHWVWAQTQGKDGINIIDSVLVLQCIPPVQILNVPANLTLPTGGFSQPTTVQIRDGNNNPLPEGTTWEITAELATPVQGGKVDITGTLTKTIPNWASSRFPGPEITHFTFSLNDVGTTALPAGTKIKVTITVDAPGIEKKILSFYATVV